MSKKFIYALFIGMFFILAPQTALAGSETIASDAIIYEDGQYKAGTNIEPGEYMLFNNSGSKAYFCLSSDANQDDIIQNDNFDYDMIVNLKDGQYLEIKRCYAVALDSVESLDLSGSGMFKVGTHIAPGEYNLVADDNGGKAYCCIYSDIDNWDIDTNDNFDGNKFVEVSDGDYLLIKRCHIENPEALFSESSSSSSNEINNEGDAEAEVTSNYEKYVIGDPNSWTYFDENDQIPMPDSCIKDLSFLSSQSNLYIYVPDDSTKESLTGIIEAYGMLLWVDCGFTLDDVFDEEALMGIYSDNDELVCVIANGNDPDIGYYLGVAPVIQ